MRDDDKGALVAGTLAAALALPVLYFLLIVLGTITKGLRGAILG